MVRAKKNLQFKPIKWKRIIPKNVLSDANVELTGLYPGKYYPDNLRPDRSTYEVFQILGVSLTDSTHLRDLFDKTKSQNFNVLSDRNGPDLFDF